MGISLSNTLVKSITSLLQLSSCEGITYDPAWKYYEKVEEMLKFLKQILDAIVHYEFSSNESLEKEFKGLCQSVDELREIFENWQPLMSKVYFVLQVESLTEKVQAQALQIIELISSSDDCIPAEMDNSSLEQCAAKIKHMGLEETSSIIMEAVKDHTEGSGASSESLAKIADRLSLKSNQELLIEAVALEKLKENAEQAEKIAEIEFLEQMISLVTHMHDLLVIMKQSQACNPVPIPPDFCCPLSLELMTDPVIVASGQTYERAFIKEWIDLGYTVCPKTRQPLAHTNLIPNYTVKALIANWCESNNVKLPDPTRSTNSNQPSSLLANAESVGIRRVNSSGTPERSLGSPLRSSIPSVAAQRQRTSPSHPRSLSEESLTQAAMNGNVMDTERVSPRSSEDRSDHSGERNLRLSGSLLTSPSRNGVVGSDERLSQSHNRTNSASSTHSNLSQGTAADSHERASQADPYVSDASGELAPEPQPPANPGVTHREPDFPYRLDPRARGNSFWRRSSGFAPRIVSSPTVEMRAELLEVESQVKQLVEDLKSNSFEVQRKAAYEIRLLAKHNMDNRIIIANCGAVSLLVNLLRSTDPIVQENSVTGLLNLSINDNNKNAIANAEAIDPLIHVLETGSPEARENAAATLFSLSVIEENKIKIGRSGAIKPLVDLLGNGTPRGKKDAATALFNLSINHENKARIVQAGAVKHLVELMDPAFGMVDKAVAVLSNLSTIHEGRVAIGQEGGIPVLVEVVELGSGRGKENAAAALLQLCTNSNRYCHIVLQEGAVPPLVALSQSGTPRAREKAQQLLGYFRNQRHGNNGRG
ncbi:U-box domain-containing protein 4 [Andrographis paniculata]|uniref:U-box domain-containing protein 4 n=1 Tax=Andrographis paniculata TaxID=175694 RepID=UPI0021E94714|nr:U-box domain-containing protein 4 [Andrographis paniculata]XP_051129574.1 U-box domain-containing protein 4 [Andrographis paniculata]XP_051129575.1 U-box domain-containing protein 4 [Andrographis paniculata]XP_051129577.1 U-box domain-containing protein 4 [Andrographis paniculata]